MEPIYKKEDVRTLIHRCIFQGNWTYSKSSPFNDPITFHNVRPITRLIPKKSIYIPFILNNVGVAIQ